jgi:hypothetical protein
MLDGTSFLPRRFDKMENFAWEDLLRQWGKEVLQSSDISQNLPSAVIASEWMGYPGATEEQIVRAEERLGKRLPPSYRAFLKVSNGWRQITYFIERLRPVEEIDWYYVRHQALIDAMIQGARDGASQTGRGISISNEDYFVYGEGQREVFRLEYLQTVLEISESTESDVFLLNPQVVTAEGEWEAWFLANWQGATRYRSFWEMMQEEHKRFLEG